MELDAGKQLHTTPTASIDGRPGPGAARENVHAERIEKIIQLIRTGAGFSYYVSANGQLHGGSADDVYGGQYGYHFDPRTDKMAVCASNDLNIADGNLVNFMFPQIRGYGKKELFKRYFAFKDVEIEDRRWKIYCVYIPIKSFARNEFTNDSRMVSFSYALVIPKDDAAFRSKIDQQLSQYLSQPQASESADFFEQLFDCCNREFVPRYWNFVREQEKLHRPLPADTPASPSTKPPPPRSRQVAPKRETAPAPDPLRLSPFSPTQPLLFGNFSDFGPTEEERRKGSFVRWLPILASTLTPGSQARNYLESQYQAMTQAPPPNTTDLTARAQGVKTYIVNMYSRLFNAALQQSALITSDNSKKEALRSALVHATDVTNIDDYAPALRRVVRLYNNLYRL